MNTKKVLKRLKNGKAIEILLKKNDDDIYTIRLEYKKAQFILHSFRFEGNDVLDESNYQDESLTYNDNFNEFLTRLETEFPGIEVPLDS